MQRSTTSGRRKAPKESPSLSLIAIVIVLALVLVTIIVFGPRKQGEQAPNPTSLPTAAVPNPVTPTTGIIPPSPTMNDDGGFEDDEEVETPALPPTPAPTACVRFSWRAGLKPGVEEPVPVEITVINGCDFEVDCSSLVFEAIGIRNDEAMQAVTGAYQGMLNPAESALLTITLPAEPEGYDRLEVAMAAG